MFFFVFGFVCLIFALYEERDSDSDDDAILSKSDNLIIILIGSAVVLFFVSAACMMSVTTSYYSVDGDALVTVTTSEYRPLAYVPLGFAIFSIILTAMKSFQMIDRSRNG